MSKNDKSPKLIMRHTARITHIFTTVPTNSLMNWVFRTNMPRIIIPLVKMQAPIARKYRNLVLSILNAKSSIVLINLFSSTIGSIASKFSDDNTRFYFLIFFLISFSSSFAIKHILEPPYVMKNMTITKEADPSNIPAFPKPY